MKTRRKIIAISIILLLLAIPMGIVQAGEVSENNTQNETIPVELVTYQEDGTLSTEKLFLSEEELVKLKDVIKKIMDEIQNSGDWKDNTMNGKIRGILSGLKIINKRAFVISSGHGMDLNPLKRITLKIRKNAAFWNYNSNSLMEGRTIIIRPLRLDMKVLKGAQAGLMTRFVGIYLSVSRGFLKESYTMFMGATRHINGIQFTPSQQNLT